MSINDIYLGLPYSRALDITLECSVTEPRDLVTGPLYGTERAESETTPEGKCEGNLGELVLFRSKSCATVENLLFK